MVRHVFDRRQSATHEQLAAALRDLADQLSGGSVDLAYCEWRGPTEVRDPVRAVVDLRRGRHRAELVIRLSWPLEDEGP